MEDARHIWFGQLQGPGHTQCSVAASAGWMGGDGCRVGRQSCGRCWDGMHLHTRLDTEQLTEMRVREHQAYKSSPRFSPACASSSTSPVEEPMSARRSLRIRSKNRWGGMSLVTIVRPSSFPNLHNDAECLQIYSRTRRRNASGQIPSSTLSSGKSLKLRYMYVSLRLPDAANQSDDSIRPLQKLY